MNNFNTLTNKTIFNHWKRQLFYCFIILYCIKEFKENYLLFICVIVFMLMNILINTYDVLYYSNNTIIYQKEFFFRYKKKCIKINLKDLEEVNFKLPLTNYNNKNGEIFSTYNLVHLKDFNEINFKTKNPNYTKILTDITKENLVIFFTKIKKNHPQVSITFPTED